jgi:tRNA(Ile)-lysidine synthase
MTTRPPAVARVLERVTQTVRSHEMFVPGETVMVAVSGGPDSMCLLESLYRLRRLFRLHLEVFHFDHRLREGSRDDALYVKRAAAKLKLPFHLEVATSAPEKGGSVEDWAHRARTWTLARVLRETGATKAAIAHTRDDQAETVLLAVIRGGGLDSATGIRPCQGPYVRPLIDCTRDEVEAFCRSLHLRPRMDPTNKDTNLLRNAIRHKVLPQLERAVDREVKATLARTADNLRFDADLLQLLALKAFDDLYEEEPDGFALPAASLLSLPQALGTRVVRTALYKAGLAPPSSEHIDAVLDLASGRPGRRRDLPGGLLAARDRLYVRVSRMRSGA